MSTSHIIFPPALRCIEHISFNMNSWVVLLAVLGCALARPQFGGRPAFSRPPAPRPPGPRPPVPPPSQPGRVILILKQNQDVNFDGTFNYDFETENGIAVQASGALKNVPGSPEPGQAIQGSYSYTADDGTPVVVQYTADENGYVPQSDILPTPPPIPPEILKALQYIQTQPASRDNQRK